MKYEWNAHLRLQIELETKKSCTIATGICFIAQFCDSIFLRSLDLLVSMPQKYIDL